MIIKAIELDTIIKIMAKPLFRRENVTTFLFCVWSIFKPEGILKKRDVTYIKITITAIKAADSLSLYPNSATK